MSGTTSFLHSSALATPIFSRQRIAHMPPHPVTHLVASNKHIVLVLANKSLQIIGPSAEHGPVNVELAKQLAHVKVHRAFLDPLGAHLLLSLKPSDPEGSAELLYLHCAAATHHNPAPKAKLSSKLKGQLVTAVAFCAANTSSSSTGPLLLGTSRGQVYETELVSSGDERIFSHALESYFSKPLADLGAPIHGLEYHRVPQTKKYFLLAVTPNRMYQFRGEVASHEDKPLLAQLLQSFGRAPDKFLELPSELKWSALSFYYQPKERGQPRAKQPLFPAAFGWLTGPGVYAGQIDPYAAQADSVTVDCQLLHFPAVADGEEATPRAFRLTEFHALLAYESRVRGVCLLNQQVVFDSELDRSAGQVRGMARDPIAGIFYVYSDYAIYQFRVQKEERNVWKIYLEQGDYDRAQQYCLGDEVKLDQVLSKRAEQLFLDGQFVESAMHYAKTRCSFEEIALKFMQVNEKSALLNYLKKKLETIRAADMTQMTMIVVWLVEIYLSRLNASAAAGDDDDEPTRQEFLGLLQTPKIGGCIEQNKSTIYELLANHGDKANLIRFAQIMKDFDRMIRYHLQNNEHRPVLDILREQQRPELVYQYGPEMMQVLPESFVDLLIDEGRRLKPARLIPSLVVSCRREQELQAIRYLEFSVSRLENRQSAIHNFLLTLYVKHQPHKLEKYLGSQGSDLEEIPYDIKYTLRLCEENDLKKESVTLYCILGQLDEAVELALDVDLEQARRCLQFAQDEETKRKIWLRIAKYVVQHKNDIKQAMDYLQQCDNLVKIEDILPFFPDFVTIDHFKDAICDSLHAYSQHIQELRDEMEESNQSADKIREEIQEYKNRYIFVRATDVCSVCQTYLMSRPFHLFNCGHRFHTDCLVDEVTPYLSTGRRRKVEELQLELASLRSAQTTTTMSAAVSGGSANAEDTQSVDSRSAKLSRKDQARVELDDLIAGECLFCGDIMVKMIDKPFIEDEDFDRVIAEWL